MPRPLQLVLALALVASAASAQVHVRALVHAGYDAGFDAPSLGVGAEIGWLSEGSGVRLGVRPFWDYMPREETAFPGQDVGGDLFGRQRSASRVGAAAVARWEAAPLPVVPYVQGGLAWEETWEHSPDPPSRPSGDPGFGVGGTASTSGLVGFSGAGVSWRAVYVEAAYGVAARSYARDNVGGGRIAVGVRF